MRFARPAWCCALLLGVAPAVVTAQGFELNEIGSCAIGRGQAVTAAPCGDASSIYWNPAAPTALSGWSLYVGAAWIGVQGNFTADTTGQSTYGVVPPRFPANLFINYTTPSHKWAAGVGVYAPYGLTSQWPTGFQGNFVGQKASLGTIYVQPNVAYQFAKDWSIGVGAVYGYSELQLQQALDLSTQCAQAGPTSCLVTFGQLGIPTFTEFGVATITGSANGWGFAAGLHGKFADNWQFGVRYLEQIKFNYGNGNATFTQVLTGLTLAAGNPLGFPAGTPVDALLTPQFLTPGGVLVPQGASSAITHPWQFQAGLAYSGFTNWLVELDYLLVGFDSFKSVPLTFKGPLAFNSEVLLEDYTNSWTIRAGAEHAFASGVKGRLGFTYVRTPVPDVTVTPILPDQNRQNYTLGVALPLGSTYTLDAAYLYVATSGRRGRVVERTSPAQTAVDLNSGWYQLHANILSVSIKASY